ncbi:hypothetical protein [Parvularcula marina]|uniref:hypothetical protein n=1 Tax=Parvularcula marina TaxID=2292771 RepID=UPI003516F565
MFEHFLKGVRRLTGIFEFGTEYEFLFFQLTNACLVGRDHARVLGIHDAVEQSGNLSLKLRHFCLQ